MKYRTCLQKKDVRKTTLYCDAYLILRPPHHYLILKWSANSIRVAMDAYVVTNTCLIPVWDASTIKGLNQYWTPINNLTMRRVHATVIAQTRPNVARALDYDDISLLCHYIHTTEPEPLVGVNAYVIPRRDYRDYVRKSRLPDIL